MNNYMRSTEFRRSRRCRRLYRQELAAYGQGNSQLLANSPRAAFWLIYIKESPLKPGAIHLSDLGEGSCVDLITRTLTLQRMLSH
jgi:hypothetical protein